MGFILNIIGNFVQAKRQQRKLNFLITQTELYAHFIGKKLTGEADQSSKILEKLEDAPLQREIRPGVMINLEDPEEYNVEAAKAKVLANVQSAFQKQHTTVSKSLILCHKLTSILSVYPA